LHGLFILFLPVLYLLQEAFLFSYRHLYILLQLNDLPFSFHQLLMLFQLFFSQLIIVLYKLFEFQLESIDHLFILGRISHPFGVVE